MHQGRSSVSNIGGAGFEKGPQQFGQKGTFSPKLLLTQNTLL